MTICQVRYKKKLFWVLLPYGTLILQAVFSSVDREFIWSGFCSGSLVYYCTDIYHIESCSWWKIRCLQYLQYFYTLKMIEKLYLLFIHLQNCRQSCPVSKMTAVSEHVHSFKTLWDDKKKNDKFIARAEYLKSLAYRAQPVLNL